MVSAKPLPSVLTTEEFAFLVRYHVEVVRRLIRRRKIKAYGNPKRIPCRELERYGVDLGDAAILLAGRKGPPEPQLQVDQPSAA
jgi:hypothetical protein